MYNLRHKRDRFLWADRYGVKAFETAQAAKRYMKANFVPATYEIVAVENAQ